MGCMRIMQSRQSGCAIEHNENGESFAMNHAEAIVDAMDVKE